MTAEALIAALANSRRSEGLRCRPRAPSFRRVGSGIAPAYCGWVARYSSTGIGEVSAKPTGRSTSPAVVR